MLGVRVEDRNKFREWSNAAVSGDTTQEYIEKVLLPHMQAFTDYLRAMFEEKRKNPKDDLISELVRAEEAGDKLSEDELLGMVFLLLVAGHETTVNLIGNSMLALLQHPDQLQKLREDPSLIKPAIEELLRYDGPVETSTERFATEDIAIDMTVIPKGEMVMAVIASADHDPERFADPDALDVTAQTTSTSRSTRAFTSVSARRSRGWKGRSLLIPCCVGCPTCGSKIPPSR